MAKGKAKRRASHNVIRGGETVKPWVTRTVTHGPQRTPTPQRLVGITLNYTALCARLQVKSSSRRR